MNTMILIPAYEPGMSLVKLVYELKGLLFSYIIVVNDGSSEKCDGIFRIIEDIPNCCVIHHQSNMGKGAALKTGMKAILNMDKGVNGCITVDSDGQHLPEDIIKVAEAFEKYGDTLVLGCRDFLIENVPAKSRFGNLITKAVFELVTGKRLSDTQTGLRAIPLSAMEIFKNMPGDRYEYEMDMLIEACKRNIPIKEVTIQTVYIDKNSATHFKPLADSARILKEILKFSFASLFCSIIDVGIFTMLYWLLSTKGLSWPLFWATGTARLISSGINFTFNKNVVFKSREKLFHQILKYYSLCIIQMLCSWLMLEWFTQMIPVSLVILKISVDMVLFVISFALQRIFVFRRTRSE